MKNLFICIVFLTAMNTFASVEDLLGSYVAKGKTEGPIVATITKVLVTQPTLFEPAKYEYRLDLEGEQDGVYFDQEAMQVSEDGTELSIDTDLECDDPGCTYFETLTVVAKKSRRGFPYIQVEYEGWHLEDADEGEYELSGTEVFFKRN